MLAFPNDTGEPLCRLVLERAPDVPPPIGYREGRGHQTAAWLMCNPSRASHLIDDPTAGRVVHHSERAGCPRSLIGNVWPLRTPYPVDLWAAIARGELTAAMATANLEALAMVGGQADIHVVAFGVEPRRRFPATVEAALDAFTLGGRYPLYCLGTTETGHPLHPLARGKLAVRNDTKLRPWANPYAGERSWAEVFSDKRLTEFGSFVG